MTNTATCGRIILLQVAGGKAMNEKSETKLALIAKKSRVEQQSGLLRWL